MNNVRLFFPDKCVSYKTFLEDLATVLAPKLKEAMTDESDVVSQRQAYKAFGRANVSRWVRQQYLTPVAKRPGKIEYRIADLRICQQRSQDYFG